MYKYFRKDGIYLGYDVIGDGYPLVFVHGWSQSLHKWATLDHYFKDYQVVLVDLPGFGDAAEQSEYPQPMQTIGLLHEFIKYLSTELAWEHKPIGVGFSYGAIFVEELSHCYADFKHCFLIDDCRYLKPFYAFCLRALAKSASKLVVFAQRHEMRGFVKHLRPLVMHRDALPADIVNDFFRMEPSMTSIYLKALPEFARERLDVPATHILGKWDRYINVKRLGSEPVYMLHSAHDPVDEDTAALAVCIDTMTTTLLKNGVGVQG